MFIKNCWYVAAQTDELTADAPLARRVIDEPLVLFRAADGTPVVFEDRCCHRWAALSKGRVENGGLRCMYHGFKYDTTGRLVEIPGQASIPEGACVRRYAATVRYGWVWVWMGDAAKADLALLPTSPGADGYETFYEGFSGQLDYDANYQLLNDNLTDFSHLSYVHSESFGASLEWAETRPKLVSSERGLHISRWIAKDTITPRVVTELAHRDMANWTSMDYLAPGVLLMIAEAYDRQAMDDAGGGEPQAEPLHSQYNWQAVTPVTATTSRYYFAWGVRRSENRPEIIPILRHVLHSAFAEDKAMIEAQQRIWDSTGERRTWGGTSDVGLHRMRRIIERLIEAESGDDHSIDGVLAAARTVVAPPASRRATN